MIRATRHQDKVYQVLLPLLQSQTYRRYNRRFIGVALATSIETHTTIVLVEQHTPPTSER
jgi:hypothetical protein